MSSSYQKQILTEMPKVWDGHSDDRMLDCAIYEFGVLTLYVFFSGYNCALELYYQSS